MLGTSINHLACRKCGVLTGHINWAVTSQEEPCALHLMGWFP